MKPKNISKYFAAPSRTLMTVAIFLILVYILQSIAIEASHEIARTLRRTKHRALPPKAPIPAAPKKLTEEELRLNRIHRSRKMFLPDGTIHLVYRLPETGRPHDEPEKVQICDACDSTLWQGLEKEIPYEYLSWYDRPLIDRRMSIYDRRTLIERLQMITPAFSQTLEIPVSSAEKTRQIWRYIPRRDLFVGYSIDGQRIGYAGSTGFTRSETQAQPFGGFRSSTSWTPTGSFSPAVVWQTNRRIYQINFEKQQVQLLLESTEADIKRIRFNRWKDPSDKPSQDSKIQYRPLIHCLTEDSKHHLIMRNPDEKLTFSVPSNWWDEALQVTATERNIFLRRHDSEAKLPPEMYRKSPEHFLQWLRKFEGKPHKEWWELYRVDKHANLQLLNRFEWTVPAKYSPKVRIEGPRQRILRGAVAASAPIYDLAWRLVSIEFWRRARSIDNFLHASVRVIAEFHPRDRLPNLGLSAVMVVLALWHAWPRRTSRAKLTFWLVFVAAFNLAGLLTYLALNHTTVIKCPLCGKYRGLGRTDCVRCGAELPPPPPRKFDLIFKTEASMQSNP